MSCILRPLGRASSSSRACVSSLPRRPLHLSSRLSSSAVSSEEPTPTPLTPPQVKAPSQIRSDHPYVESRLAAANLVRNPSTINPESYQSLSNEILLLRNCDNFFRKYHSPLLWDAFNAVKDKAQFREALELIKVWRMAGGIVDWRLGAKVVELALKHQTPLWALQTLMIPTAFGLHLHSPSLPPYAFPTETTILPGNDAAVKDFWLKYTTLIDADTRDRKAHLPDLPRTNPYVLQLPTRVHPAQNIEELELSKIAIQEEPVVLKELAKVLFGPVDAEGSGKTREMTMEEGRFLQWQGERFFPANGLLTARWLSWLKSLEANAKSKNGYLYAQNKLGEVEQLLFEGEELEEEVVKGLIESGGEEEWPLYVRTKELLEGKKLDIEGEERGFGRVLGEGMGGFVEAKEGGEEEAEAVKGEGEEEVVEEEKAI